MTAESQREQGSVGIEFDLDDVITDLRTALEGKTYEVIKLTATLRSAVREQKKLLARIRELESQLPKEDGASNAGSV